MTPDMKCPYCGAGVTIDRSDYDIEDESRHQYECEACGKTFIFTATISIDYSPQKADCLNGEPHEWQMFGVPSEFLGRWCAVCGDKAMLTEDERKEYLKCL